MVGVQNERTAGGAATVITLHAHLFVAGGRHQTVMLAFFVSPFWYVNENLRNRDRVQSKLTASTDKFPAASDFHLMWQHQGVGVHLTLCLPARLKLAQSPSNGSHLHISNVPSSISASA